MKKRILSVLISGSLLFGTVFANAVSVNFENLECNDKTLDLDIETNDISITYEELNSGEDSTSFKATDEIIDIDTNNLIEDNVIKDEIGNSEVIVQNNIITVNENNGISLLANNISSTTTIAYFTQATNVTSHGTLANSGSESHSQWGSTQFVAYDNTEVNSSNYVVYENAVISNGYKYDLVIYPFRCTRNGSVLTDNTTYGKIPALRNGHGGYSGYKLVITEHNNISHPLNVDIIMGMSDIDGDSTSKEYIILPSDFSPIHIGSELTESVNTNPSGKKYVGSKGGSSYDHTYDTGCLVGKINIPTDGIIIYYGIQGGTSGSAGRIGLTFDGIQEDIYTISFNANGGSGSIPSTITKYGLDTSVVMGDIGNSVPTRSGYTFKGWSVTSTYSSSNKRIAYTAGSTGATTTSSSWSYATYCANTGGNSSNKTLTLYAQWEAIAINYTHTLAYNANGGTNAPSSSTATNTSSTYSMTVSSSQPTRTGYTFAGWNTNSSGTGTSYSAGNSVLVGANATVTLYAKWTPITYSITYNGNGNTGGSTASQTKAYDVAINLQNNGFTKTGYHFTGWNTATNGTGTSYSAGASYSSNANLALYAQWAVNSSTLSVNPNGGTWNNSTTTQSFTQNYNTTKSIPVPTRTGYTFTGWTRSGTNGTMTSLTSSSTYMFGASNGVTDILTAEWKINNYTVTYIDVIDSKTGKELGKSTASKPYNSTVRGSDKGSSKTDSAYYNGYYYVSDTSATVTTSGATVYRIFKQRMNTIAGNIIWEDWNNKNLSRPENVNLYIKGSDGKTYSYVITGNHSQNTSVNRWPYSYNLPKYDSNGKAIVYTVSQDKAISQEKGLSYQEPLINGYDITNKITNMIINTEDYFQIPVTITWDDENDFYGFRPETATIQLLRNGEVIKTADVSDSYTFTELLKYDENGDKYVYTIQASDEKRYTKVENNSAPYNKTVTYTFVNSYFSVLIPKVIVLDGIGGNANYDITVNGAFYYNDTLIPGFSKT